MGNNERKRSVREELEPIAPNLAKMKEVEPKPDIPEGYFDQLSFDVFQRIREEETTVQGAASGGWSVFLEQLAARIRQPVYAVALAGVALLLIGIALMTNRAPVDLPAGTALSEEDINDYIDLYIDDFDLGLLAEEAAEDRLDNEILPEGDSLNEELMEDYFDELLDDIDLEELL